MFKPQWFARSFFTLPDALQWSHVCREFSAVPGFRRIGALLGAGAGKINTIYPCGSTEASGEPGVYFHDAFRPDGAILYESGIRDAAMSAFSPQKS